jgi:hypothetical protein
LCFAFQRGAVVGDTARAPDGMRREGYADKDLHQSRPFDELSPDHRWRRLGGKQYRRLASFCDAGRRVVIDLIRW